MASTNNSEADGKMAHLATRAPPPVFRVLPSSAAGDTAFRAGPRKTRSPTEAKSKGYPQNFSITAAGAHRETRQSGE